MQLTQKETMLLQDLKSQEQLCVEKYRKYTEQTCDEPLKKLFASIGQTEQTHLDTITQMLSGTVPMMTGGSDSSQQQATPQASCSENEKKQDAYLCQDALGTEKHVSSTYNTCIFEFKDAQARNVLNHIQKEEQDHGKRIYDYMAANGMYA
ncbi:MAG: spore coat protein [Clostridia bacterium]